MIRSPSPNGAIGRDADGRFAKGNAGGPGNPYAQQIGNLRSALIGAVTEDDMRAIVGKLIDMAKAGDIAAIRELLSRLLGRPTEADLIERLEHLETVLHSRRGSDSL